MSAVRPALRLIMRLTPRWIALVAGLALVALAGGAAHAAGPLDEPGFAKSITCAACHGQAGNSRSDFMPIIAGMTRPTSRSRSRTMPAGKRPSPEMEPYAKMVLCWAWTRSRAYFGEQKMRAHADRRRRPHAVARGRAAAAQCAICHGPDGKGDAAMLSPSLAGQPPGYPPGADAALQAGQAQSGRPRAQGRAEGADADHPGRDVHGPRRVLLEPPVARPQAGAPRLARRRDAGLRGRRLIVLGFVGAFVSGLVGVGGAIVMIPLLYYVPPVLGVGGLDIKDVAGHHHGPGARGLGGRRRGRTGAARMVHRRLAVTGGAAMAAGSLIGAIARAHVSGRASSPSSR